MRRDKPVLRVIDGGRKDEAAASYLLYPERRRVKAEVKPAERPRPQPPYFRPAA